MSLSAVSVKAPNIISKDYHSEVQKKSQRQKNKKPIPYSRFAHLGSIILENGRKVSDTAHQMFVSNYQLFHNGLLHLHNVMKFSAFLDLIFLPFIALNITKQVHVFKRGNRNDKIDATIQIVSDVSLFGRSAAIIAMGMATFNKASVKVLEWSSALFFATSILSFTAAAAKYRTYKKMRSLEREFAKIGELSNSRNETSVDTFLACLSFIKSEELKDKEFITNAFGYAPDKLASRLAEIENIAVKLLSSSRIEVHEVGRMLLNNTLKVLKGHIHHIGNSALTNVVISAISMIAAGVFFFSPMALGSYVAAGLGFAANLGALAHHKIFEYRYAKNLGISRKWHEWAAC